MEKHSESRLSYLFAHLHLLSSDSFSSDLLSSDLFSSDSSHLCFSTVHIVGSFASKLPSIIIDHHGYISNSNYHHGYIYIDIKFCYSFGQFLGRICLKLLEPRWWCPFWRPRWPPWPRIGAVVLRNIEKRPREDGNGMMKSDYGLV